MKKDWRVFNSYHLKGRDFKLLEHARLAIYVNDNPDLTYDEYETKAKALGVPYMTAEQMRSLGFCNALAVEPKSESFALHFTGVEAE